MRENAGLESLCWLHDSNLESQSTFLSLRFNLCAKLFPVVCFRYLWNEILLLLCQTCLWIYKCLTGWTNLTALLLRRLWSRSKRISCDVFGPLIDLEALLDPSLKTPWASSSWPHVWPHPPPWPGDGDKDRVKTQKSSHNSDTKQEQRVLGVSSVVSIWLACKHQQNRVCMFRAFSGSAFSIQMSLLLPWKTFLCGPSEFKL